jgi:hypothetical protein
VEKRESGAAMTVSSPHTATTLWRLEGEHAHLACDALQATIDVTAPHRGLAELSYRGVPIEGWLLGVEVESASSPSDAYIRGNDLVVVYREKPERPFSVQVYWSATAGPARDGMILDATVSIQTRQWEAYPRVMIASPIAQSEMIAIDAAAMVMRPAGVDWSYVEVTLPGDFALLSGGEGRRSQDAHWLFGEQFMERGVIRRLRLRGAIVPRANDLGSACRLRDALAVEQPPLTA